MKSSRTATRQTANEEGQTKGAKNDGRLNIVRIEGVGEKWQLQIFGNQKDNPLVSMRYSAKCKSIDECLEQLDQWRKGVIIV